MTAVGTMITGRYRLVQQLAVGGMGSVWEAWDELLQRPVAVKQLLTQPGTSADDAETARLRVIREARITARLHHPHAVTLYDVVEQDGHPCLIMQYVPSKSLSTVLREAGTLDIGVVTRIATDLASALAAAHRVGIVHRDVKPGNVLITEDGSAKLTDFGISHAVGDVNLTSTGIVTGTPAYLAPEVARGEPSGFPADVFSLAATMYAALEGFPPFGSDPNPMALLHRVASGRMLPPSQSGPLTPLLLRMLSTRPTDRPSMAEVLAALTSSAAAAQNGSEAADRPSAEQATFRRTMAERAPERPPPVAPTLGLPAVDPPIPTPAAAEPFRTGRKAATNTAEAAPRRRPVAALIATALALAVVAAVVIGVRALRTGDDPVAGGARSTVAGQSTSSSAPASPSSPASSAAPSAAPAPAGDSTPPATSAAEKSSSTVTSAATTTKPSSTPPTSATPTSSTPRPTPAPADSAPTATQLAATIADYYAIMPGDTDGGWARLTPSFQSGIAQNREYYQSFWDGVSRVTATDITATPPNAAEATITYYFTDGRVSTERTAYTIVRDGDSLKIDDSSVLTSNSS